MGERLKGKVAVITGSGRGIGRGIALLMAREGARIVVNDLGGSSSGSGASTLPADEVVAEIKKLGGEAVANYESVATPQGGENIIETAVDRFGKIDILVNNAGIIRDRMIYNMTEEEWDAVIKVHLYGHFHCTRPASLLMRQQKSGRIINVSSRASLGNTGQANYSAAKAGIIGFTFTVARDLGKYGITCNAIMPHAGTRIVPPPEALASRAEREVAAGIKTILRARDRDLPDPEDIAPMVVYLASDEASGVNGQVFYVVDNEITLYPPMMPVKGMFTPGKWTLDEIARVFPGAIGKDLVNPAPPEAAEKK